MKNDRSDEPTRLLALSSDKADDLTEISALNHSFTRRRRL